MVRGFHSGSNPGFGHLTVNRTRRRLKLNSGMYLTRYSLVGEYAGIDVDEKPRGQPIRSQIVLELYERDDDPLASVQVTVVVVRLLQHGIRTGPAAAAAAALDVALIVRRNGATAATHRRRYSPG